MIDIMQAITERHSVRSYTAEPIEQAQRDELQGLISDLNAQSGLSMELVFDDPRAFEGGMARYGNFSGVRNYLAIVGPKGTRLDESTGYFGEQVVLRAQQLGLNSCWVALTYSKGKVAADVPRGSKLACVVALGHGTTPGIPRKSKQPEEVIRTRDEVIPEWFIDGVDAALLAPTAMNQQKFVLELNGDTVAAIAGGGFYTKMDLGIVKLHFELGAGKENFRWA